jgi:hypothetical protein
VLTSRLCVVHSLPFAIRLEESVVPDAFWFCAESCSKEAITDPNAILAIDTTQPRIVLVLSLTPVIRPERWEGVSKRWATWQGLSSASSDRSRANLAAGTS